MDENFEKKLSFFSDQIVIIEFKKKPVSLRFPRENRETSTNNRENPQKTDIEKYQQELREQHAEFLQAHQQDLEKIGEFTEIFDGIACRVKSLNPEIEAMFSDGKILRDKLTRFNFEKSAQLTTRTDELITKLKTYPGIKSVSRSTIHSFGSTQKDTSAKDQELRKIPQVPSSEITSKTTQENSGILEVSQRHTEKTLEEIPTQSKQSRRKTPCKDSEKSKIDLLEKEKLRLWDRLGGPGNAGENIIVGVLGTGIDPTHLAFSDRIDKESGEPVSSPQGELAYGLPPLSWQGICQPGEEWPSCSNKIIGARYYNQSYFGDEGIRYLYGPLEVISARDTTGESTHQASVIAGNFRTPTSLEYPKHFSGIAPRARIAVYKIAWRGRVRVLDLLFALEDVVSDGCHVIDFTGLGNIPEFNILDITLAFIENAIAAGLFIAQPAGNAGPEYQFIQSINPFCLSVAASENPCPLTEIGILEIFQPEKDQQLVLRLVGEIRGKPFPILDKSLVLGTSVKYPWVSDYEASYGFMDSFDPTQANDKILVLYAGGLTNSDKSRAARRAGALGLVIVQRSQEVFFSPIGGKLNTFDDSHLPLIALSIEDSQQLLLLLSKSTRVTLRSKRDPNCLSRPAIAEFSSRGPIFFLSIFSFDGLELTPDLLKPDLCVVGEKVLGAFVQRGYPDGYPTKTETFINGTGTAAGILNGYGCLLRQLHPSWSPMSIKSALMTTTTNLKDESPLMENSQFKQGAGFIRPNRAADPGLVFDANLADWDAFYCESDQTNFFRCEELRSLGYFLKSSEYNNPGIFLRSLVPNVSGIVNATPRVGSQSVSRLVTNVFDKQSTYTTSSRSDGGLKITITPSVFTLDPGQTQKLVFEISPTNSYRAASSPELIFLLFRNFEAQNGYNFDQIYNYGCVRLIDQHKHKVRIPVAASFVDFYAPLSLEGFSTNSVLSYDISKDNRVFGNFRFQGLVKPELFEVTLTGTSPFSPQPDDSTQTFTLKLRPDTDLVRIQIFPEDLSVPEAYIFGEVLDYRFQPVQLTSFEPFNGLQTTFSKKFKNLSLQSPYYLRVSCFDNPQPSVTFRIHVWYLGSKDHENLRVISYWPREDAGTYGVTLQWSGLDSGTHYLGNVIYENVSNISSKFSPSTLVMIHT